MQIADTHHSDTTCIHPYTPAQILRPVLAHIPFRYPIPTFLSASLCPSETSDAMLYNVTHGSPATIPLASENQRCDSKFALHCFVSTVIYTLVAGTFLCNDKVSRESHFM